MSDKYETVRSSSNIYQVVLIGVMSAVICIMGPFSIPIGPVPIALSNLGIYLAAYLLGKKKGTISCLIYLLIGFAGVPVFSNFGAGVAKLFGPTGGYLIGYMFMAFITGYFVEKFPKKVGMALAGMIAGTVVTYALGTAWLVYEAHMSLAAALAAGVFPFIIGDLLKMIMAVLVGSQVKKQLVSSGLLK